MEKRILFIVLICYYPLYSVYHTPASDTADVPTTDEYKVKYSKTTDYEKSIRDFLKLQAGVVDTQPKQFSEMTITEMLFAMNPWKEPEPINVCDDRIPCLLSLLLKQKYDFISSHIYNFAANYGYKLNKYHVFFIWLAALWVTKILTTLVSTLDFKIFFFYVLIYIRINCQTY